MLKLKLFIKILVLFTLLCCFAVVLSGCQCKHEYDEATCISGKVCKYCGEVEGEPLLDGGHKWADATCLVAMKCELCGDTKGSKLGHNWSEATCQSPMRCNRCNATQGVSKSHLWIDATCSTPKTCDYCGQTSGVKLGHNWIAANCTEKQTCQRCGGTTGSALGHSFISATCTKASKCSRCNEESGKALGHDYYGGLCRRCGIKDANFLTVSNSYATYYFIGIRTAEVKLINVTYTISGNTLTIAFDIKKNYDILGSGHNEDYTFDWKLVATDGVVIDSGYFRTESLEKNEYDEGFKIVVKNIDLGKHYKFYLVSDSLSVW